MNRVSVVGTSGSGKSTFAKKLAEARGVPFIELDALHWGPNWTPASAEALTEKVIQATDAESWVTDGNYRGKIGSSVWDRADTVVWIDLPRRIVMWRIFRRTVRRIVAREELWSGNRESWKGLMFWRGEDSILWWAWTSFARNRKRYAADMADPAYSHLVFHRLRTKKSIAAFLANEGIGIDE